VIFAGGDKNEPLGGVVLAASGQTRQLPARQADLKSQLYKAARELTCLSAPTTHEPALCIFMRDDIGSRLCPIPEPRRQNWYATIQMDGSFDDAVRFLR
jgi:hypothetical protein